jgi:hypothetical protein
MAATGVQYCQLCMLFCDGIVSRRGFPGKKAFAAEINRSKKIAQQFSLPVRDKNNFFKERAYSCHKTDLAVAPAVSYRLIRRSLARLPCS